MKKLILICLAAICSMGAFSQAKKPIIMIVPSDQWCNENGFMTEFDNMGQIKHIPNYGKALITSSDLQLAIGKISEMMIDRGFPLKNLEAALKTVESEDLDNQVSMSKDGSTIAESPKDRLKRAAKADIIMQLSWKVNKNGPNRSVTFNLQGLDAYTDKTIAGASGTGQPSFSVELPVLLEESILAHLDNFNVRLQSHFDDMFANGREITMQVKRWADFADDFETDYSGEELGIIIENWVAENCVNNRFSTTTASANMMTFEQVRIPLFAENGRAIDARTWGRGLQKMLSTQYQIDAKVEMEGLGKVVVTVGGK